MTRQRIAKALASLLVMALLVAACSPDDSAGEDTTTTAADSGEQTTTTAGGDEATTTTAGEPEPVRGISEDGEVKLGTWIAQSGPLAVVANIANALQLRLDQANEAGGVNGYTFSLETIDDQADPSQTVNAVRELWEDDEVFGLLHPYGSGGMSAVQDYLIENEIPLLFPFADSRILFGDTPPDNAFGFVPFYADAIYLMMEHVQESAGVNTVAVLHTNDPLGEAGPLGAEAAAEELGMEVVETVGYDSTETNYAPLGRRLADSGADAILIWSFTGSVQVLQAALESGYEGVILLHDGFRGGFYYSQLIDLPFDLDGRTYTNVWWVPVDEAGAEEYAAAFSEAYPDGDVNLGQSGWAAGDLFLQAVEEATADGQQLTWQALKDTLLSWQERDIGMSVGITYSDTQRTGATKGKVRQLQDGAWVDAIDWTTYARYR
jgi:branched-chain amino acid transport system substrate-binding protein